jgi:hypothetical protein
MPDQLTGRCNCGAVSASFAAPPVQTRQCWCRQCQKTAAGGATHNAMFRTEDVTLQGHVAEWHYTAHSGNVLTQAYCRACGNPVFAQSSARLQFMTFRIGFLEGDHGIAPEMAIWTNEKPTWAMLDPSLPSYPAQPPPPGTPSS